MALICFVIFFNSLFIFFSEGDSSSWNGFL
jgi:hypothetical protein